MKTFDGTRWNQNVNTETNVKDFGAKGDGVTDDTVAIQAAHNSGYKNIYYPEGRYYITKSIVVSSNQKVYGTPTSQVYSDTDFMFYRIYPGSHNVTFDTMSLEGNMPSDLLATSRGQYGISVEGTWDNKTTQIIIQNCTFNNFKDTAIRLQHVVGFQINNNNISNHGYIGIGGLSARDGVVFNNTINGTGILPGYSVNTYGITFSQSELPGELGTEKSPKSSNVLITGNRVVNQAWTGIDSHCGERITITDNHVIDCNGTAISVLYSDAGGDALNALVAPRSIVIQNNQIEFSRLMDPPEGIGNAILLCGSVSTNNESKEYVTGVISGNLIRRMGKQDSPSIGAISIRSARGVVVSDNVIEECRSNGIIVRDSLNTKISRNVFIDLWKTSGVVPVINANLTQENAYTIYFTDNVVMRGKLKVGIDLPEGSVFSTHLLSGTNSSNITFVESGNERGTATSYITQPVRYGINGNTKIGNGTTFPDKGQWDKGDLVYNTNPTAGGNVGWICVSAGTPGTWRSFGNISN